MFSYIGEQAAQIQLYDWGRNKEEYVQIKIDAWK